MGADALVNPPITEEQDAVESARVAKSLRTVYRLLDDGVERLGGIAVGAGLCGMDRGDLRRALDRNGRRIALDHALAIAARLRQYDYGYATRIGAALVEPLDLLVFPRVTLTDKERADRLEAAMRTMPMGEELIARVLGGTR